MRTIHVLAFDAVIEGTAPQFIDPVWNQPLATPDKLRIVAIADTVSVSGGTPQLTVHLEESGDNRNWATKVATPEISAGTLSTTSVTILAGSDTGGIPTSGFLRAKLFLGGTTPRARIQLWITGRGEQAGG